MGAETARSGWWLRWIVLPLGRLLHLLGFRLRFWFTFPFPYHPLIALVLPFVPLALVGWAAFEIAQGGRPPVSSWALLGTGLLLIVPLSFPLFNVIAFAFRVPLLQGFCFLSGMVLLGAEVVNGSRPPAFGALPAAFFLLFLVQRLGGPIALRRVQKGNAAFTPVDAGERLVFLDLHTNINQLNWHAHRLIAERGVGMVAVPPDSWRNKGRITLRATREAHDLARELVPLRDFKETGSGLQIELPDVRQLRPSIVVRPVRRWFLLLNSSLTMLTVEEEGRCQRLASGRVSLVGNWPLFVMAYDFAIFSGGSRNGRWHAGFLPRRETVTLDERRQHELIAEALVLRQPSVEVGPEALEDALAPLRPYLAKRRAELQEEEEERSAFDAAVEVDHFVRTGQVRRRLLAFEGLTERPELLRGKGKGLCGALARAKEQRIPTTAEVAARLLSAVPIDEFVELEEQLLPLLGSRVLALDWQITPDLDLSPLPRNCPRWGPIAGFGLMKRAPELWSRLGELGPTAAKIVAHFIKEVGERPMLAAARDRLAERGIPLPPV